MNIYELAEQAQRELNFKLPQPKSKADFTPGYLKRVATLAKKTGFTEDQIIAEVISSEIFFRANILPEPGRQGVHEKTLEKFIQTAIPTLSNSVMLTKSGKNAKWFHEGNIVVANPKNNTKSIDLQAELVKNDEIVNVYGICKYTNEGGGAQDNQHADVVATLKHCTKDQKFIAVAILDGDYYRKPDRNGTSKHDALQAAYADYPNVIIADHSQLKDRLDEWLAL